MRKEIRTVQRDGKTFQQAYWVSDNTTEKGRVPKIPGVIISSSVADLPKSEKPVDRFTAVQKERLVGFEMVTKQSIDEETGEVHNWGYMSVMKVGSNASNQLFNISGVLRGADDVSWGMDFFGEASEAFVKYFSDVDSYDVNDPDDVEAYYQDYGQGRNREHAEYQLDNHAKERDNMLKMLGVELYAYLVYGETITVENGEVGSGVEEKINRQREEEDKQRRREQQLRQREERALEMDAQDAAEEAEEARKEAQKQERNKTIGGRIRNRIEEIRSR